jgi:hypothetical protein
LRRLENRENIAGGIIILEDVGNTGKYLERNGKILEGVGNIGKNLERNEQI